MVKIIIINGSPRPNGSTSKLASIAAKGVEDGGGVPEIVRLYDYRIEPCKGCVSEDVKKCYFPCPAYSDDFNRIAGKLVESEGFIIATPVYWYAPSGVLKNFIDRLTSLENMIFHIGKSLLDGKVAGFIAVGADSGVMMALSYLMIVMNSMGVLIPPWAIAYTHNVNPLEDEQAVRDAYNVGLNVARAAKLLKNASGGIWYKSDVDLKQLAAIASRNLLLIEKK
ncbi:flavodoxin family protein [Thermogladius sp. 4427co]|uniref:flavodoxin family protein n=1 Tax=Thermogladius sp. 4427co TaxID=3450718 RepID=UPI003F793041